MCLYTVPTEAFRVKGNEFSNPDSHCLPSLNWFPAGGKKKNGSHVENGLMSNGNTGRFFSRLRHLRSCWLEDDASCKGLHPQSDLCGPVPLASLLPSATLVHYRMAGRFNSSWVCGFVTQRTVILCSVVTSCLRGVVSDDCSSSISFRSRLGGVYVMKRPWQ